MPSDLTDVAKLARHYGVIPMRGETEAEIRERVRKLLTSPPRSGLITKADLRAWIETRAPGFLLDEIRINENVGARAGLLGLRCYTPEAYVVMLVLESEIAAMLPAHVAMQIDGPDGLSSEDISAIQSAYRIGGVEAARKLVESSDYVYDRERVVRGQG